MLQLAEVDGHNILLKVITKSKAFIDTKFYGNVDSDLKFLVVASNTGLIILMLLYLLDFLADITGNL